MLQSKGLCYKKYEEVSEMEGEWFSYVFVGCEDRFNGQRSPAQYLYFR
jgi:hypothetical protein